MPSVCLDCEFQSTQMKPLSEEHIHACMAACDNLKQVVRVINCVELRKGSYNFVNAIGVRKQAWALGYRTPWCLSSKFCHDNSQELREQRILYDVKQAARAHTRKSPAPPAPIDSRASV